ncbi:MAG: endonuclease/exonuclease/phosphatase family protein [Longimicrobiales bacterium]|nr:endonuclease/exonuclease/phosphatase family protein [Longimicrobiales bacterium]
MTEPGTDDRRGGRRAVVAVLLLLATLTVTWWAVVRVTASSRVVGVHRAAASAPVAGAASGSPAAADARPGADAAPDTAGGPRDTVRVLAWNIAHVRGDLMQGSVQNFRAGDPEVRASRLARIAAVIRGADPDIVVLNEVDFDAAWSDGLNQARTLARALGATTRVEQRNFDYSLLFADFAFGNAVLSRLPVGEVRPVSLPPMRRIEAALIGAKRAAAVEVRTAAGAIAVVPIHLEFRSERTRLAAVEALEAVRDDAPPTLLAGDFNTSPPGWPGVGPTTAVGQLLAAGWSSPRAAGDPDDAVLTFPSPDPRVAIDWVLAEPPLRILESRVIREAPELSDHLPVLAVVEVRAERETRD